MSLERLETAPTRTRYIPAWPALAPWDLLRFGRPRAASPPFDARRSRWFYRASNAIYHLTKALELGPGDVVLAPDWHSGNEVWAMRAAGARVVYYPIRRNREPDLVELARLCRVYRPRVLYVIHFMGWPQPMDELLSMPRGPDTVVVEDCALSLYAHYRGRPVGTFGDYAVYCPYKTLPMPNGPLCDSSKTRGASSFTSSARAGSSSATVG
jgi:dTDP-4-amino-4,6-dideoxygalactose transaminase